MEPVISGTMATEDVQVTIAYSQNSAHKQKTAHAQTHTHISSIVNIKRYIYTHLVMFLLDIHLTKKHINIHKHHIMYPVIFWGLSIFIMISCKKTPFSPVQIQSGPRVRPEMVNRPVTMAFEQGFASALHARHPGAGFMKLWNLCGFLV